ncbi:MAG: ChaN family lipoprotein [Neisseriaceae bacterium]|nr:ChaN family lipoprotein [Neisseriaceae bacterium]
MKFIQKILILCVFLVCLLPTNVNADNSFRLPEKLYDNQNQQWISFSDLMTALKQADIVLIGEQHSQKNHHLAKEQLLRHSEQIRKNGSLLLEMIDEQQQSAVRDVQKWLNNGGKTGIRHLPEKINWQHSWAWEDYGPMVHYLLQQKPPVLHATPSRKRIEQSVNFTPTGKKSSAEKVKNTLLEMMNQHAAHGNAQALVNQQQFKDSYMAQQLLLAPKPAWLIAGAVHTAKNIGVPLYLQDANYQGKVLVIILTTDDGLRLDPDLADIVWYLPESR